MKPQQGPLKNNLCSHSCNTKDTLLSSNNTQISYENLEIWAAKLFLWPNRSMNNQLCIIGTSCFIYCLDWSTI